MSTTPHEDPRLERLLDRAENALDEGDVDACVALCRQVLDVEPRHAGALFVWADALRHAGDLEGAVERYHQVTLVEPHHSVAWSGRSFCLFDLLSFEQAGRAAQRSIREDDRNAEAYAVRGMLRERRGDFDGAHRDFVRASRLDPEGWPLPLPLSDGMIEGVVRDLLTQLHPAIRSYLAQVPILLEEVPSAELCAEFDPPAPPGEILGVFSGPSLGDGDGWTMLPPSIVLFRRNLQRVASDPERMVEELRITVFHEVGHFLGLDEDDLEARGLE
jgi:predicted Zn-dependent protease with MMP-like domain